jgi:hypothetical protein
MTFLIPGEEPARNRSMVARQYRRRQLAAATRTARGPFITIPANDGEVEVTAAGRPVALTNLDKTFWPRLKPRDRRPNIHNMPARIEEVGDLWKPLLAARGRFRLEKVLDVA